MSADIFLIMDLKDELENELAMAILIEKRVARKIGTDGGRELIGKIKGVLSKEIPTDDKHQEIAEAASAH